MSTHSIAAAPPAPAGVPAPEPRMPGRTSDLRYQVNLEDPRRSRWPELKARISTAGYDPGAA